MSTLAAPARKGAAKAGRAEIRAKKVKPCVPVIQNSPSDDILSLRSGILRERRFARARHARDDGGISETHAKTIDFGAAFGCLRPRSVRHGLGPRNGNGPEFGGRLRRQ